MVDQRLLWLALIASPFLAYLMYVLAGFLAGWSLPDALQSSPDNDEGHQMVTGWHHFPSVRIGNSLSILEALVLLPLLIVFAPLVLLFTFGYAGARMARETGHSFYLWGALCTALPFLVLIPAHMRKAS